MNLLINRSRRRFKISVRVLRTLFSLLLMAVTLVSCNPHPSTTASKTESTPEETIENRLKIITTIFPHYDFVRAVVGEYADVTMLLPPGVETHSYDPTPADIIAINESDLFIYTGADMEAWAESILQGVSNENLRVVALAEDIDQHHDDALHDHEDDSYEYSDATHIHIHELDPHIWTSPVIAATLVDRILSAVCELDPENEQYYINNADAYKVELKQLDAEFRNIVETSKRKEIFFGDRFALQYFADEYGLEIHAAFDSCSAESEPSASTITSMINEIIKKDIPVIFYAELNDPKIARSLSEATGAEMLLFHSCHNVTKEEFSDGVTYIDLMRKNAENLRKGLN